jgi:hypothetical protein
MIMSKNSTNGRAGQKRTKRFPVFNAIHRGVDVEWSKDRLQRYSTSLGHRRVTSAAEPVFRSQLRFLSLIDRKVPGLALQRQTRVMTAN